MGYVSSQEGIWKTRNVSWNSGTNPIRWQPVGLKPCKPRTCVCRKDWNHQRDDMMEHSTWKLTARNATENQWLESMTFPVGMGLFSGAKLLLVFRECNFDGRFIIKLRIRPTLSWSIYETFSPPLKKRWNMVDCQCIKTIPHIEQCQSTCEKKLCPPIVLKFDSHSLQFFVSFSGWWNLQPKGSKRYLKNHLAEFFV